MEIISIFDQIKKKSTKNQHFDPDGTQMHPTKGMLTFCRHFLRSTSLSSATALDPYDP